MGTTGSRVVAMIGAALAMGGCEGFDGGSAAEVTDSAGSAIVDNGALPGTWGEGEGWTVRTALEIGGDESGEETIFGGVAEERLVALDAWAPRPTTAEDVDVLEDLLAEKLGPYGMDRTAIDGMDVPEPEALPGIAAVASLPDGTLLVQRGGPAEDVEPWALNSSDHPGAFGGPTWDVLDPEGFYLGSVTFPERFRPLSVTPDALYGVRRDELGTPLVVRLALDRG